jgi:hypothetical protein
MDLFSNEIDKSVKSPNLVEWETIELELKRAVKAAEKSGDKSALQYARQDYYKHLQMKDAYIASGKKQLSIFDI